jgi:hypothetical protein
MEYCSSCLRPINGWLVCPGCGAYAPSIAPPARADHTTAVTPTATSDGYRPEKFSSWAPYSGALPPEAAPVGTGALGLALGDSSVDGPGADSPSGTGYAGYEAGLWQGRAARRRQMAHWKKHRRRAAAATAVALIGGGLTVAAVQNASPTGSPTAGSAPESLAPVADPTTAVPSLPVAWQTSTRASATPSTQPTTPRAVRSTAATYPQPDAVTMTRATRASSPSPSTTPPATYRADTSSYTPSTMTSHTNAPASATSSPDTATTKPSPTPPTTSPTPLCLLILCVG